MYYLDKTFAENFSQKLLIGDIALVKTEAFSRNILNGIDNAGLGIVKIIHYDNVLARLQKLHNRMRADKSGAARY